MITYAAILLVVVAISASLLTAGAARALVRHHRVSEDIAPSPLSGTRDDDAAPLRHRVRHFLAERFSPRTALGLQLTAAVVFSIVALALFGDIADSVLDRDELARLDERLRAWIEPYRTPTRLSLANWVSHLGTLPAMTALAALLIATLFRREWRAVAVGWMLLAGGGELVEQILKRTFRRDRPPMEETWLAAGGFSFPSGHSMGAMVGYGLLIYLVMLRVRRPWARIAVIVAGVAIVAAIGFSRIVLGVHFFTDVIGGFAAGIVWISLAIATVEVERSRWRLRHSAESPAPRG